MSNRRRSSSSGGGWLALFSYIAVILLGVGLLISLVLSKIHGGPGWMYSMAGWIKNVAIAIALIIPLIYSFYASHRFGVGGFVFWIISVVLIVITYIIGLI